ncbi:hypothetical protein ABEB36_010730 [Hypothenemus hampei]|uniref:DDE Tnp4 domain-containing protein n=1 Tax=Hypothenemus hampei TaxID=57062 RepID=A0ABD1ECY3_HYPHA
MPGVLGEVEYANGIGAIDGKHIEIECPPNSGSMFFNYKKTFSIVLMAICDANYYFTHVDIGAYGSQSDEGIFHNSPVGKALLTGQLPVPNDKELPGSTTKFLFYFVGDAAFPLKSYIMPPVPGQLLSEKILIFNYRLSRARRIIENSFGILVARWRVLKTSMKCFPNNAETITLACIALHNCIKVNLQSQTYTHPNYTDWEDTDGTIHLGEWRREVNPLRQTRFGSNNAARSAFELREHLANFFLAEGAVPFQLNRF